MLPTVIENEARKIDKGLKYPRLQYTRYSWRREAGIIVEGLHSLSYPALTPSYTAWNFQSPERPPAVNGE
jgi:hypothetical protein